MICFKTARRDHSSSIIQLKICQDRLRTGQLQDLPRQAAARFCFERVCLCLEWSVSQDAQSTWELFQNLSDRLRGMPLCGLIRSSSSLFPLPRVFPSVFRKPGSVYQDRLGTRSSLARESDSFAINKGRCLFLGRYRRGFGSPAETVWEHTDDFAGDVY